MGNIIEIKDHDANGILTVDLKSILQPLSPEADELTWSILDLEATGELVNGKNMLDLEQEIRSSPNGLIISWNDLLALANSLDQVINATIVACKDPTAIPGLGLLEYLCETCEIVLQAIDSSLWCVYARDDAVIDRFATAFHDVQIVIGEDLARRNIRS